MTLRIALVDDNPMDRHLAAEALDEVCPGCLAETFASGQALLRHLHAAPLPDLLLLDLNMPGLTGLDVLQALKADPRLSLMPVVVLTTSSAPSDIEQAYALHASSYLVKAATFTEFLAQVDALIRYWTLNRTVPARPAEFSRRSARSA